MNTEDRMPGVVLIVDDDPKNLKVLNDFLQNGGFRVLVARDGFQCLESAELGQPDVIILDVVMPVMDGHETCEKLKKNPKTKDIPVLFLSALAEPENILNGFNTGGVDYIAKPFRREEVLARVMAHVTIRRQQKALVSCNIDLETEILEKKRTAAVLAESEAKTRALLEAMPDLMFRLNRDGVYLDYKADKTELYAQEAETIIGKNIKDMVPDFLVELTNQNIEATLRTGEIQVFEYELPIPDQGQRNFETRMVKSGANEVTAIVRDITERKQMEKERLRMQCRLQTMQRLESLGVMAGGIAHDFISSLMVVLGNLELANLELAGEEIRDDSPIKRYLDHCEQALQRQLSLARQMAAYSGLRSFAIQTVDIERLIRETFESLTSAIPENISLRLDIRSDLPKIEGDASQIKQILTNLIENAAESHDEQSGGEVTISAGAKHCDRNYLSDTLKDVWLAYDKPFLETVYVFIDVLDTGCGMDAATRNRIFEPFFTTKFLGRGLGLAAVFGIMRGHRGYIRVNSRPGRGTKIRILFPAKTEAGVPKRKAPPATDEIPRGAASSFWWRTNNRSGK